MEQEGKTRVNCFELDYRFNWPKLSHGISLENSFALVEKHVLSIPQHRASPDEKTFEVFLFKLQQTVYINTLALL